MNSPLQSPGTDNLWTVPTDVEQSIPERFRQRVTLHADTTAVVSETWQPTYRELDQASDRISQSILTSSAVAGERVVLLARHDSPILAGMLGILKAGRVVVALNPSDPVSRLEQLSDHAEASLILADSQQLTLAHRIARKSRPVLCLDDFLYGKPAEPPEISISPGDIAFLVYTSGSTGNPKGVIRSHRCINHIAYRLSRGTGFRPGDRFLHLAALSGGSGVSGACAAILNGVVFYPFPMMETGVTGLAELIEARGITVLGISSSLFRNFVRTLSGNRRFPQVRLVRLTAGSVNADELAALKRHFSERCEVVHTLSSSETGTITRLQLIADHFTAEKQLPVGEPSEDVEVLLYDENDEPVPAGQPGQIVVRSRYLASGYWRDEVLTSERFSVKDGVITFRSGDVGRWNSQGLLAFAGREDSRIKIRGYRIEPSEVEDALRRQPGIADVAVGDRPNSTGETQLVAWYTADSRAKISPSRLRSRLSKVLPSYMIPADFVHLEKLPVAANGKIDRAQLRLISGEKPRRQKMVPPRTDTEQRLAQIWEQAFQEEPVGRHDHIIELGGDSLVAAVIAAHIHAEWGVEISMQTFGDLPTVRKMAKSIDRACRKRATPIPTNVPESPRDQPVPLSFAQEAIWNDCRVPEGMRGWTIAARYQMQGDLNVELLQACMRKMLQRHAILRTTFELKDGIPSAIVHSSADLPLEFLDFSAHDNPAEDTVRFYREAVKTVRLDLGRLPLVRFWLIRNGAGEYQLLKINHHIVSDSWSWKIYFDELTQLYEASLQGRNQTLPRASQYADYAAECRATKDVNSFHVSRSLDWWKQQFSPELSPLNLPFQRSGSCEEAKPADGVINWEIPPEVSQRLDRVASRNKSTYFSARLAVFLAALAESNGQSDLVIGTYSTGRTRLEWQNTLGMFAHTLALRFCWNPRLTFERWVRVVSERVAAAQEHDDIPHQLLHAKLSQEAIRTPEINALFCVTHHSAPRLMGDILLTKLKKEPRTMPWGFTMMLDQQREDQCHTWFNARIHDPQRVQKFLNRYLQLLDILSQNPRSRLSRSMQAHPPTVFHLSNHLHSGRVNDAA